MKTKGKAILRFFFETFWGPVIVWWAAALLNLAIWVVSPLLGKIGMRLEEGFGIVLALVTLAVVVAWAKTLFSRRWGRAAGQLAVGGLSLPVFSIACLLSMAASHALAYSKSPESFARRFSVLDRGSGPQLFQIEFVLHRWLPTEYDKFVVFPSGKRIGLFPDTGGNGPFALYRLPTGEYDLVDGLRHPPHRNEYRVNASAETVEMRCGDCWIAIPDGAKSVTGFGGEDLSIQTDDGEKWVRGGVPVGDSLRGREFRGIVHPDCRFEFASEVADPLAEGAVPPTDIAAPAEDCEKEAYSPFDYAFVRYLRETVAPNYGGEWEHCVPVVWIVGLEDDPPDILAWGEFRVFNYRLEGDTFHFVSGGNHPGLMRLRETNGTFSVVSFDPVLNGSEYTPSAKRIFGRYYDSWNHTVSDGRWFESERLQNLADYADRNNLSAKYCQDPDCDRVRLPSAYGRIDPELEQILHEPIVPASALEWREAAITDVARFLEAASPCPECLADRPSGGRIRIAVSPPRLGEKSFGTNKEPRVSLVPSGNAPDRRFSLLELASLATEAAGMELRIDPDGLYFKSGASEEGYFAHAFVKAPKGLREALDRECPADGSSDDGPRLRAFLAARGVGWPEGAVAEPLPPDQWEGLLLKQTPDHIARIRAILAAPGFNLRRVFLRPRILEFEGDRMPDGLPDLPRPGERLLVRRVPAAEVPAVAAALADADGAVVRNLVPLQGEESLPTRWDERPGTVSGDKNYHAVNGFRGWWTTDWDAAGVTLEIVPRFSDDGDSLSLHYVLRSLSERPADGAPLAPPYGCAGDAELAPGDALLLGTLRAPLRADDRPRALVLLLETAPPPRHAESAETAPPADPATKALTNSLDSGAVSIDNSPHLAK